MTSLRSQAVSSRQSLRASILDGTFSAVFENIVRGVLISNFLLGLGAGTFEVGLLTSIPMMAHLLQPLGAYWSEKPPAAIFIAFGFMELRGCCGYFQQAAFSFLVTAL